MIKRGKVRVDKWGDKYLIITYNIFIAELII